MGVKLKVSGGAIAGWEQGRTIPDSYSAIALAKNFKVSIDWLLLGVE